MLYLLHRLFPDDRRRSRREPFNHLAFRAHCIVRRVQPSGVIAVELLSLSDRNRRQLRELMEELAALSPPISKPEPQ